RISGRAPVSGVCRVHPEARRHGADSTNPEQRGSPHGSSACERGYVQAGSLVCPTIEGGGTGRNLASQASGNRARLVGLSDHPLLRIWIFAPHSAASQPQVVENRAATAGAREIPVLRRDHADILFAP